MIQLIILLILLIPILAIVLDSQLGRALAARLENRTIAGGDDATQARLAVLEAEVERLGSEMSRLEDEGQFLHRLLTERSPGSEGSGGLLEGGDAEQG